MATTRSAARPDFAAHDRTYRLPVDGVVAELRDLLGARLVAYLAGVTETRAVREWAEGIRTPRAPPWRFTDCAHADQHGRFDGSWDDPEGSYRVL